MQEITDLEQRITAALERIGNGVDRVLHAAANAPPPAATAASGIEATLRAQLAEEKALTAQLQDRLRAHKDRDPAAPALERPASDKPASDKPAPDKVDRLTQQLDVQGLELQRMRRTVTSLRDQLQTLRQAQTSGLADPHLINKTMAAELEALRATRLTEMAEMDEILAALEPHLAEASHA